MSWTLAPSGPRGATLTNESTVNCAHNSRSTRDPLESSWALNMSGETWRGRSGWGWCVLCVRQGCAYGTCMSV